MSLNISSASFLSTLSVVRNKGFAILSFDHDNRSFCVKRLPNKPCLRIFKFKISFENVSDSISLVVVEDLVNNNDGSRY